jgi:glucan phosphoethanolaminetransferase (alkaline phosphatase superfamily)
MFAAQALMFASALLGPQGLKAGALLLVIVAGMLAYAAKKIGRRYARNICASEEITIEEKIKKLKSVNYVLWPALLVSSFLGVAIASIFRGA